MIEIVIKINNFKNIIKDNLKYIIKYSYYLF